MPGRISRELCIVGCLPRVGGRAAIHQHLRRGHLAIHPQQGDGTVLPVRQILHQLSGEGGIADIRQQRRAALTFPARLLHCQKRLERQADRARRPVVDDIDDAERRQPVPVLTQFFPRRAATLHTGFFRHEWSAAGCDEQRFDAARSQPFRHRRVARAFRIERREAEDVRQQLISFDGGEERGHDLIGERRIDDRAGEKSVSVGQRFRHLWPQWHRLPHLQRPDAHKPALRSALLPGQQHAYFGEVGRNGRRKRCRIHERIRRRTPHQFVPLRGDVQPG